MLLASLALAVVWCLATVVVYLLTYTVSVTLHDWYRWPAPWAADHPFHSLIALMATLVWCAVTANLPI